jgi:hypothetical protein
LEGYVLSNSNSFNDVLKGIGKFVLTLQRIDWEKISNNAIPILKFLDNLPEYTRRIHCKLASNGWFLIGEVELNKFPEIMKASDEILDKIMTDFTNDHLDSIVTSIYEAFPHRAKIIQKAVEAHNNELFELSVPVFLIQADGISSEILNVSFFSKRNGKPKTGEAKLAVIEADIDEISTEYYYRLLPLDMLTSLNKNTDDLQEYEEGILNRHNVIHGHDCDYGSITNSSKGIILLKYLTDLKDYTLSVS